MMGQPRTLFLNGSTTEFLSIPAWIIQQSGNKHPWEHTFCKLIRPHDGSHVRVGGHDFLEVMLVAEYNDLIEPTRAKPIRLPRPTGAFCDYMPHPLFTLILGPLGSALSCALPPCLPCDMMLAGRR